MCCYEKNINKQTGVSRKTFWIIYCILNLLLGIRLLFLSFLRQFNLWLAISKSRPSLQKAFRVSSNLKILKLLLCNFFFFFFNISLLSFNFEIFNSISHSSSFLVLSKYKKIYWHWGEEELNQNLTLPTNRYILEKIILYTKILPGIFLLSINTSHFTYNKTNIFYFILFPLLFNK